MTEPRSPLEQALDLMLFAPIGLALTVVEDFPELAQKGRARLQQRATTARIVGQFAVAQGRRRLQGPPGRPPAAAAPRPVPPSQPVRAGGPATSTRPVPSSQPAEAGGPAPAGEPFDPLLAPVTPEERVAPVAARPTPSGTRGGVRTRRPSVGSGTQIPPPSAVPPADSLAIPGYDSLSASQVVQRLASLSGPELAAVRDYEAATRGRRTILARVSQLQA